MTAGQDFFSRAPSGKPCVSTMGDQGPYQAALNGSESVVLEALKSKPDLLNQQLDKGMYTGYTLLHCAAAKGHASLANTLLNRGALTTPVNPKGKTAADLAEKGGHVALASLLRSRATRPPPPAAAAAAEAMVEDTVTAAASSSRVTKDWSCGGGWPAAASSPGPSAPQPPPTFAQPQPQQPHTLPHMQPQSHQPPVQQPMQQQVQPYVQPMQPQMQQPMQQQVQPPMQQQVQPYLQPMQPQMQQPMQQQVQPQVQPQIQFQAQPQPHYQPPQASPHAPPLAQQHSAPLVPLAAQPQAFSPPQQHAYAQPVAQQQAYAPPAATMHFAPPQQPQPAQPQPTAPQPPPPPQAGASPDLHSAVVQLLQAKAPAVQEGKYLAVVPSDAFDRVIGAEPPGSRISPLCDSNGAKVELDPEKDFYSMRIFDPDGAAGTAKLEAMLWEVIAPLGDSEACGAGVPVAEPLRTRLSAERIAEVKSGSGAEVASEQGGLYVWGSSLSVHLALLLLLRDVLGSEHARKYEAYAGTLHASLVPALTDKLAGIPPASADARAARPRLLLQRSAAQERPPLLRGSVWVGRDKLQPAASAAGAAAQGAAPTGDSQLLHLRRFALRGAAPEDGGPPPLLCAAGVRAAVAALALRLGDGAVRKGELQAALAPLAPLDAADVTALTAAVASSLRDRLLGGGIDAAALQTAEVATVLIDRAAAPRASPANGAAPKRERPAPMLSFGPGVAAAAAKLAHEPEAPLPAPPKPPVETGGPYSAAAAEASGSSDSSDSEDASDERRRRKRKEKKEKKRRRRDESDSLSDGQSAEEKKRKRAKKERKRSKKERRSTEQAQREGQD